jgi:hypothetical protein
MKKLKKITLQNRLKLDRETLRILTGRELGWVVGGKEPEPTDTYTDQYTYDPDCPVTYPACYVN